MCIKAANSSSGTIKCVLGYVWVGLHTLFEQIPMSQLSFDEITMFTVDIYEFLLF